MQKISRDDVKTTYRRYAPVYNFVFGLTLGHGRAQMAKRLRRLEPSKLLEIGVGTGLALPQYPFGCDVTGIDISEEMLTRARQQAKRLPERKITLACMDAESLDFPDASFDCVTLPYVLSVTPHPEKLVAEMRRVCKKGGCIIILNHFSGNYFWRTLEWLAKPLSRKIGFRSEFSYEANISVHDWKVTETTPVNVLNLSRLIVIENV